MVQIRYCRFASLLVLPGLADGPNQGAHPWRVKVFHSSNNPVFMHFLYIVLMDLMRRYKENKPVVNLHSHKILLEITGILQSKPLIL